MDQRNLQIVLKLQNQMSGELSKVNSELGGMTKETQKTSSGVSSLVKNIMGIATAYISAKGIINSVKLGLNIAADLQTATIGLTTLLGSAEEAKDTVNRLKQEASRTPFELPGLTQATQLLTSVTKDGNKSIDIILDIGEGLAAMGKGQSELDRIIVNLQQIASVGKAATIDIKQFAFAGIPIYEMLAETTGKAGEELGKFIEEGGVTFDVLVEMFDKANDAGGRFFGAFENQTGSYNQALSNLKDSWQIFLGDLVTSTGLFDKLTKAMVSLSEWIGGIIDKLKELKTWFQEHEIVVWALAGAITGGLIAAFVASIPAIVAFAASMWAAAAGIGATVIAAAPFLLIGAAIAAVAFLIIKNWDSIAKFFIEMWELISEKTKEVWDNITNWIGNAWENIKNAFTNSLNFMVGLIASLMDWILPGWEETFTNMLVVLIEKLTEIYKNVKDFLTSIVNYVKESLNTIFAFWKGIWGTVSEVFTNIWNGIKSAFQSAIDWISEKMEKLVAPIQRVIDLAKQALSLGGQAVSGVGNWVSSTWSNLTNRGSTITGLEARALGGPVTGGTPYLVGERGPELFVPRSGGTIIPNGAGGGGVTVIVNGDVSGDELLARVQDGIMNLLRINTRLAL